MADILYEQEFSDEKALKYLEDIEKQLVDVGKAADKTGEQLNDALNPADFGLGVQDGLNDLKKKYAELVQAAGTLRKALRSATDPAAIALYKKGIADLDGGIKTLETTAKKAGVSLKEVNKEVGTGKQVFENFFGAFTKVALITAAIEAVVKLTKFAVDLAQQTKVATRQFEGFLGSADKAADVVGRLQAFAGKKILDSQDVLNAGKSLLAFGEEADNLENVLSRVADISAATGKNFGELVTIYGKARAAGVLYAEDINQLVDAGIPIIGEFAKQMGVSTAEVKKLASEGKIGFEELQLAFFNLTQEGGKFADQAEANAQTLTGVWQNLFNEVKPAISAIGEFFSDVASGIGFILTDLVKGIKDLFGAASAEQGAFFDISKENVKKGLTEEEQERKKLEEAAARRRAELANQQNKQAADAAAKRRKQRIDEFNQVLADVDSQAAALDISTTFNPIERVEKQYADALAGARKLQETLSTLADTPEQKALVQKSMEALFTEIVAAYDEELSKAEIELEKLKGGKLREALNPLPPLQSLDRNVKDVLTALNKAADEFIAGQQPRTLAEILGISEESLGGLKDAAGEIISALSSIADARVKEAEAATQAAERKVQAAEDALQREQELAAQGLANDSDLRKKQLEEAKKQREAALKEEAKARRSQILLDSIGQLSSLATASANIFKALSPIPFAGIPLAIATIGLMFGAFAKAKADALKAASVPKFRKGTKLEGRSHEAGGLAISDEHGNIVGEAEGDEWLIGTKPSREHDQFLKRLNQGEFEGVNLDRVFRPSASNPITEAAPRIARIEQQRREMEQGQHMAALAAAYERTAERIVGAIEAKPDILPWKQGYKERRRKGNITTTKIVQPEN